MCYKMTQNSDYSQIYLSQAKAAIAVLLGLICIVMFLPSCVPVHEKNDIIMSTNLNIKIYSWTSPQWKDIYAFARREAMLYDHRIAGSPLYKLNHEYQTLLPHKVLKVLNIALFISRLSQGAFDPSILPVLQLWDFDHGGRLASVQEIEEKLTFVDYRLINIDNDGRVTIIPGMGLDLGGIAKGAVVDALAEYLEEQDFNDFLIEAGGDIIISGKKSDESPWKIAIRQPRAPESSSKTNSQGSFICIVELEGIPQKRAIVTSGDYERFFIAQTRRYHHILDPHTGYPAQSLVSVTVIADTCTMADGLSTAAFVLGWNKGLDFLENLPAVEGLLIRESASGLEAQMTSGFPVTEKDLDL